MTILERYQATDKKKQELYDLHKKIEVDKDIKTKSIQRMKKIREEKIMFFNARIKELKEAIDNHN